MLCCVCRAPCERKIYELFYCHMKITQGYLIFLFYKSEMSCFDIKFFPVVFNNKSDHFMIQADSRPLERLE